MSGARVKYIIPIIKHPIYPLLVPPLFAFRQPAVALANAAVVLAKGDIQDPVYRVSTLQWVRVAARSNLASGGKLGTKYRVSSDVRSGSCRFASTMNELWSCDLVHGSSLVEGVRDV